MIVLTYRTHPILRLSKIRGVLPHAYRLHRDGHDVGVLTRVGDHAWLAEGVGEHSGLQAQGTDRRQAVAGLYNLTTT